MCEEAYGERFVEIDEVFVAWEGLCMIRYQIEFYEEKYCYCELCNSMLILISSNYRSSICYPMQ